MNKKSPISFISVAALAISAAALLMFLALLDGFAVLNWWYSAIWVISSAVSVFCPIGAKAIRIKEGSRGKAFEIIALIVGFFDFNFALMYTTTLNGTLLFFLALIPCILYAKLFNPKPE